MDDLRGRLVGCFSLVFADLLESEIPLAASASLGTWDSLANLSLITVIEEEFNIKVADDDVSLFLSFELVYDYVKGKVNVAA